MFFKNCGRYFLPILGKGLCFLFSLGLLVWCFWFLPVVSMEPILLPEGRFIELPVQEQGWQYGVAAFALVPLWLLMIGTLGWFGMSFEGYRTISFQRKGKGAIIQVAKTVTPAMLDNVGHMNYIKGYLSAMEHGRLELMRALGWTQERLMLEHQCALMIGTLEAKYLRQAFLGDKLVIEGTIESFDLYLKYSFQIWKNKTDLIFQGGFSMPLVDIISGKMIRNSPGWILETA